MGLKRTQADIWFSRCVRERANWVCELCKTVHPDAQATGRSRALHCSHFIGRGNWSVRFDAFNAFCHCYACHVRFGSDKYLQEQHYAAVFFVTLFVFLKERKQDTKLGRFARKSQKEITKHYKNEYNIMRDLRAKGRTGRIEFENWI